MMAITIEGQAGAGGIEIGRLVAGRIEGKFVQKQAIRRVARQLDATVEAVVRKELAFHSRWKRVGHQLEAWLAQMGRTWAGDPWSMSGHYAVEAQPHSTRKELPGQISNSAYRDAVYDNAARYLAEGNVVLTHRAGCLTLKDRHEAVHIGLFAPRDKRVARVAYRYRIGAQEADEWVETMDAARSAWFRELADQDPQDRSIYDITLDVGNFGQDDAAALAISEVAMEHRFGMGGMEHQTQPAPA
ncbi:MAG: cytidylate kinase family protein [Chloroflexi bacterium]|nr:cytidylate kinase family protein [Chloroflexota bacterium]